MRAIKSNIYTCLKDRLVCRRFVQRPAKSGDENAEYAKQQEQAGEGGGGCGSAINAFQRHVYRQPPNGASNGGGKPYAEGQEAVEEEQGGERHRNRNDEHRPVQL